MHAAFEVKIGERYQYHGKRYEVLDIRGNAVQMRSTDRAKSVVFQNLDQLRKAHNKGYLVKYQEAPLSQDNAQVLLALPEKNRIKLERKLWYVEGALEHFHGRLPKDATKKLIAEIAKQFNDQRAPGYSTLHVWLKAYLQSNRNPFSLLDLLHRKKTSRFDRLHPEIRELLQYYLDLFYLKRPARNISDVVWAVITSTVETNRLRPVYDQLPLPSKTTLYRTIKEIDPLEVDLAQKGWSAAIREHGWSRRFAEPARLFDLAECDTHEIDLILVDKLGRPIGKAWLTTVLLVKARYVIGYDLSLNPPSISKTVRALRHSLTNTRSYTCQVYLYIMDNGPDFKSVRLRDRLQPLGSKVLYCEPREPNQKPHIESWHDTLATQFSQHLKGTTFASLKERGDYDSEKEAVFTLESLRAKFEEWLAAYHADRHDTLNLSPNQAWEKFQEGLFPPRRYSPDQLDGIFLSRTSARISKGRVRHNYLQWTGPGVARLGSLLKPGEKAIVYYDESELGRAWVAHPRSPELKFVADAVDPDYQNGLTMYTHNELRRKLKEESKKFSYHEAKLAKLKLMINLELEHDNSKKARRAKAMLNDILKLNAAEYYSSANSSQSESGTVFYPMSNSQDSPSATDYAVEEVNHDEPEQ